MLVREVFVHGRKERNSGNTATQFQSWPEAQQDVEDDEDDN